MIFTLLTIALMFIARAQAMPHILEERALSTCLLDCIQISLSTGCNGVSDLSCLCNNAAFRNVLTSCTHQVCPDEDDATAQFQEQQCANYSTLSAHQLIPIPSASTPTPNVSAASSSPAPLQTSSTVVSSDVFAQVGADNGSKDYSDHSAMIIGIVVGLVLFLVLVFFLVWWRRRGRGRNDSNRRANRASVSTVAVGHAYREADGEVRPWFYPSSSNAGSSRRPPSGQRPLILTTTPITKPRLWDDGVYNSHTSYESGSPARGMTEHSGSSAPPRRLTKTGLRLSIPPPAYQPSSSEGSLVPKQ